MGFCDLNLKNLTAQAWICCLFCFKKRAGGFLYLVTSGSHWAVRLGHSRAWVITKSYRKGVFFFHILYSSLITRSSTASSKAAEVVFYKKHIQLIIYKCICRHTALWAGNGLEPSTSITPWFDICSIGAVTKWLKIPPVAHANPFFLDIWPGINMNYVKFNPWKCPRAGLE